MSLDYAELLRQHSPILIMYPQDPGRRRPGAPRPGKLGWGDYHPCSAEFFLARVQQRDQPKPYDIRGLLNRSWEKYPRTGLEAIERKLAATSPEDTREWELDVSDIPSQSERHAWAAYGGLLKEDDCPYERVVYGRWYQGSSGLAVQYWYLYLYNDFGNNHEADWEMVAIELAPDGSPQRIGVSCHHGGWSRSWEDAPKEGDRPLVYVARGSHGGYFVYRRNGHHVVDVVRWLNLTTGFHWLGHLLQKVPLLGWRDHPPADPMLDPNVPLQNRGTRIEPELRIMPPETPSADSDFWWMRYQGKWGSSHTRLLGTIGPDSPWRQGLRWEDPVSWVRSLRTYSR